MDKNIIGIRREDKHQWERRVPLTPKHVETLIKDSELKVVVQNSPIRAYKEEEYKKVGATISESLSTAPTIFAVKEIPATFFEKDKTYIFFAHVIKGQKYNMPMLKRMMELNCNLIDYEKVVDEKGRRLIFFGHFAGLAGMIDSLWSFGRKLEVEGVKNPFSTLKQATEYDNLNEAKEAIKKAGKELSGKNILPYPIIFGFTGYGNVSKGAQEVFNVLPHEQITPDKIKSTFENKSNTGKLFKVVFEEKHMVEPVDKNTPFELQDYFKNPQKYKGAFEQYLPYLSVIINCIYWDARYPRLVTKDYLKKNPDNISKVLGDITCDINGSIECNEKCTTPGDPVYTYNPKTNKIEPGVTKSGPVVLAVDTLPCELPKESSEEFGNALISYVPLIAACDFNTSFDKLTLPAPIKAALILHKGMLTPSYKYIEKYL